MAYIMYAIVEIGSKQYRVEKDIVINIDKVLFQGSEYLIIDKVLMLVNSENILVGQPYLDNVKIKAKILGIVKGEKIRGIKFKKRKNYTRTLGFRPEYLKLKIEEMVVESL